MTSSLTFTLLCLFVLQLAGLVVLLRKLRNISRRLREAPTASPAEERAHVLAGRARATASSSG